MSIDVNYMDEPKMWCKAKNSLQHVTFKASFKCLNLFSYKIQEVEDPIKLGAYALGPNWKNK